MAHIDFKKRSITAKVVYYGCGLCGKTTNLEYINQHSKDTSELMAVSTEGDRTIFFDFLPVRLGTIRGIETQFKLYAVPGQVRYNMTRKLVLKDVDGVVFVVDSQKPMVQANLDSLENLYENLREQGVDPETIPVVMQYNKRDLKNVLSVADLEKKVNRKRYPAFGGSAVTGEGVFETLDHICRVVFDSLCSSLLGPAEKPEEAKPAEPETTVAELQSEPSDGSEEEEASAEKAVAEPLEGTVVQDVASEQQEGPATAPVEQPAAVVQQLSVEMPPALLAVTERLERLAEQLSLKLDPLGAVEQTPSREEPEALAQEREHHERLTTMAREELDGARKELAEQAEALRGFKAAKREADMQVAELERSLQETKAALEQANSGKANAEERVLKLKAKLSKAEETQEALRAESAAAKKASETATQEAESAAAKKASETTKQAESVPASERTLESETPEPVPAAEAVESSSVAEDPSAEVTEPAEQEGGAEPTSQEADPYADNEEHKAARRVARVMVGDLLLYHKEEIEEGIRSGNVEETLSEQIAEARKTYESRVPEHVRSERDHLAFELAQLLEKQAARMSAESAAQPTQEPEESAPPAAPSDDEAASEKPGEVETAAKAPATEADPFSEDRDHQNARRIARVMVGDLLLYHRDQVSEGIRNGNVQDLLSDEIAEARKTYESRVSENVRKERDYLALEFERMIAKEKDQVRAG